MSKLKVKELIPALLSDFLAENSLELYHIEFVKEGKDWFLRVFIDKLPYGSFVGTDDCEKVSRYLSGRLDEADPIRQNYYLEVSSPGLDRTLFREEHYDRFIGSPVEVRLYKASGGKRDLSGILKSRKGAVITIEEPAGTETEILLEDIAKTRLAVIF